MASKNIINKLNIFDRDILFAVVFIFINIHDGSLGANGEIDMKNSYIIIDKNNMKFKIKYFRLHIYHISLEYNTIL